MPQGSAVLDVACGTGVAALTAARAGARVHALDLTPELLEHARRWHEMTIGPLAKIVGSLKDDPGRLAELRARFETLAAEIYADNRLQMQFLMARAVKVR